MKGSLRIYIQLFIPFLLIGLPCAAYSLDSEDIVVAEVELSNGQVQEVSCYDGRAGLTKVRKGQLAFNDYQKLFRKQQKKFKKTADKRAKKKSKLFKQLFVAGSPVCQSLKRDTVPTPTPSATPTPSTTPTPSPTVPASYFNSDGSVNSYGKIRFGIPEDMEANLIDGQTVFFRNCSGCHEERTKPDLASLREATSKAPMLFNETELPDQNLADLLAYLGRFESPYSDGLR